MIGVGEGWLGVVRLLLKVVVVGIGESREVVKEPWGMRWEVQEGVVLKEGRVVIRARRRSGGQVMVLVLGMLVSVLFEVRSVVWDDRSDEVVASEVLWLREWCCSGTVVDLEMRAMTAASLLGTVVDDVVDGEYGRDDDHISRGSAMDCDQIHNSGLGIGQASCMWDEEQLDIAGLRCKHLQSRLAAGLMAFLHTDFGLAVHLCGLRQP